MGKGRENRKGREKGCFERGVGFEYGLLVCPAVE
jgi:hypothetical protein